MSKRAKDNTKITKFFVKKSKPVNKNDTTVEDAEYEKLKQDIIDLKARILELSNEKLKLQSALLPADVKMKDIEFSYVPIKQESNWGVFTKKKQLKFHELSGMVVNKIDENQLTVDFRAQSADKVHKYGIMLKINEQGEYSFGKAVLPPSIKIKELLKIYPLDNVQRFLSVIATNCQVFHDIDDQIRNFKNNIEKYNIEIVHSNDNRYILLRLPLIYLTTNEVFDVHVHLEYGLLAPRPEKLKLEAAGMPEKYLSTLKRQFHNLRKYELLNGFEISVREDLRDEKSTFHWLKTGKTSNIIDSSILTVRNTPSTNLSRKIKVEKRSTVLEKPDQSHSKNDSPDNFSLMFEIDAESEERLTLEGTNQTQEKLTPKQSTNSFQLENSNKYNLRKSKQNKANNQTKSPIKTMEISKKSELLEAKKNSSLETKQIQDNKIETDYDAETVILKRSRRPRNVQRSEIPRPVRPQRKKNQPQEQSESQINSLAKQKSRKKVTRK